MKKTLILFVVLSLLVYTVLDAFAGDVEKALFHDLSECSGIVKRISRSSRSGGISTDDIARLKKCSEALQADRLLLAERQATVAEHTAALGGNASDRQDGVSSALILNLDELLTHLDTFDANATSSDLDVLQRLLDTLVPKRPRPLLGVLPYKHTNYPSHEPLSSPIIKPAYKGGDRSVYAADTVASPEAPLSKEIAELAQSLQWNPVMIYEWVKNNVETEWYWGSMKGAEETLRQKSGNDADQASLLVALLRASNFPARYVRGTIDFFPDIERAKNLTGLDDPARIADFFRKAGIPSTPVISGGRISNLHIEHIWVEAFIPYANYRGAVVDDQGKIWLGMDTSIKPQGYTRTTGGGVSAETLSTLRDNYLSTVQTLSPLDYLTGKLDEQLAVSQPGTTWASLKDTATLIPDVLKIIPDSLQFNQVVITGEYQSLPDELKHKLILSATAGDNELFSITLDTYKLSNKRLALRAEPETVEDQNTIDSFGGLDNTPAYLVRLRPVLTLDGERLIVAQDGLPMGADFTLNIDIVTPNGTERISSGQINGNLSVIGVVAQQSTKSTNDTKIVETDDAETILHKEAISYIDRWNKAEDDLAHLLGQRISRPTVTIATVGGQMAVTTLMDVTHDMQWQGLYLDAGYKRIETVGRNGLEKEFLRLSALQGSVLENRIFEDDLKVDSVSTAKLLQLATANSTPLVSIDKTTIDAVLPTLPFDDAVKADITNAVNQDLTVTIPQNEVVYQDWSGIGYIKENAETGESGWMLSGNVAGGMTAVAKILWMQQDFADLLQTPYTARPNTDITKASRAMRLSDGVYQIGTAGKVLSRPLMAQVVDAANRPVKGISVTFRVTVGGGTLQGLSASGSTNTQADTAVTVTTGRDGIARARLTLGKSTSAAPLYMTGSPNSIQIGQNLVVFSADTSVGVIQGDGQFESFGYPGDAVSIVKVAESTTDNQTGNTGTFSGTLWAQVVDQYGNPVSNKPVTFVPGSITHHGMTPAPGSGEQPAKLIPSANSCSGIPTLSCAAATDSITVTTGYTGAVAGVILGNVENTDYSIDVTSTRDQNGEATNTPISTTFTHHTLAVFRSGDTMMPPYLGINYLFHFDDHGNRIDVGAAGSVFGQKLLTELINYEEKHTIATKPNCSSNCYYLKGTGIINPTKVNNGRVDFTSQMVGGSVSPASVTNTDSSVYATTLTLGATPSLNIINATGSYQAEIPAINSMTGVEYKNTVTLDASTSISVWGIGLSLDATNPIFIDKNGYPETDTYFPFQINPRAYSTRNVDMRIFEGTNYLGFVTINPSGQLTLSQGGAKFDLAKRYTADMVLNWGSGIEVRSITVPLDITSLALIPDYDHNRKIDDKDRQRALNRDKYYFWVNDDDGKGDIEGSGIPNTRDPATIGVVNGTRDLIDYFPVQLDISRVTSTFAPGTYLYRLKNADGSLSLVLPWLAASESGKYLTDIPTTQLLANAPALPITAAGLTLDATQLQVITGGKDVVLLEGCKATQSPLVLEISDSSGKQVYASRLNLSIAGVEQMFRHKNLVEAGDGPPPIKLLNYGAADRLIEPANFPDSETNDKHFVFVHGYNVNGEQARGWNAEMFKRMYWSGSKAKFWGTTWYGWDTQDLSVVTFTFTRNFHINVQHALKTAPAFSDFINLAVGGKNVTVAAHSLGNMLVSSAISEQGAKVDNYFLIDAAVPIEAYDGAVGRPADMMSLGIDNTLDGESAINNMIHPAWSAYKVGLYASEWYRLFPGNDWRSKLTWRDRFGSLPTLTKAFNFYSSGEDVLDNHSREPYVSDIFTEGSGRYAWALQEKLKGMMPTGWMLGSNYGGWGLNKADYNEWVLDTDGTTINVVMQSDTANQLFADNPEQFRIKPFFRLIGNDLQLLVPGVEGSNYAKANRDRLLAEAIPALSRAAGKTVVSVFDNAELNQSRNFDMQANFKNGWPDFRSKIKKDDRWLHSDMRDIAYPFINGLFRNFVERGGLQ